MEGHPEWETPEAHPYGNPYASTEWNTTRPEAHPYSMEGHPEWETPEAHPYGNPYASTEWELPEAHPYSQEMEDYASTEWEDEGEFFFKRAFRGLKSLAKRLVPIGKLLAPLAARALGSMIPGLGVIAGPLAGQLTRQLVREGEMEAMEVEAQFFGTNESEAEVGQTEAAHEAALTELLAHEAAQAESEAEAEALLGGTLPITITIMGGRRALRPVMPTLTQANGRLVQVLRRQGPPVVSCCARCRPSNARRSPRCAPRRVRAGRSTGRWRCARLRRPPTTCSPIRCGSSAPSSGTRCCAAASPRPARAARPSSCRVGCPRPVRAARPATSRCGPRRGALDSKAASRIAEADERSSETIRHDDCTDPASAARSPDARALLHEW